jgi:predicted DsbA family dithiol-disulfide isomerase
VVQVFFDYECPYCDKGYDLLMDLLPAYPSLKIEWIPIESHPRPETQRPHTDLCIQAFYIAEELGADVTAFHRAMYRSVAVERRDVENAEVIAEVLKGIVDIEKLLEILKSGKYASRVAENNDLAYEKNDVWFVPAFRVPGNDRKSPLRLDAKGGLGVSRKELKRFLDSYTIKEIEHE